MTYRCPFHGELEHDHNRGTPFWCSRCLQLGLAMPAFRVEHGKLIVPAHLRMVAEKPKEPPALAG